MCWSGTTTKTAKICIHQKKGWNLSVLAFSCIVDLHYKDGGRVRAGAGAGAGILFVLSFYMRKCNYSSEQCGIWTSWLITAWLLNNCLLEKNYEGKLKPCLIQCMTNEWMLCTVARNGYWYWPVQVKSNWLTLVIMLLFN